MEAESSDPADAFGAAMERAVYNLEDRDGFMKARQTFMDSIWDEFKYSVIDKMPEALEMLVRDMSDRAVNAMLMGRPIEVKRYLNLDGWTGRTYEHPVINGKLMEPGPFELRRQVANANEKLLRDARILDLESQVKALTLAVVQRDATIEKMRDAAQ